MRTRWVFKYNKIKKQTNKQPKTRKETKIILLLEPKPANKHVTIRGKKNQKH